MVIASQLLQLTNMYIVPGCSILLYYYSIWESWPDKGMTRDLARFKTVFLSRREKIDPIRGYNGHLVLLW